MIKRDPERYRRMQVPHVDSETAALAFEDFCNAVDAAREKFKIADVLVIACIRAMVPGPEGVNAEGEGIVSLSLGDPSLSESLAAYAYGQLKKERELDMERILAGGKKNVLRSSRAQ